MERDEIGQHALISMHLMIYVIHMFIVHCLRVICLTSILLTYYA